MISAIRVECRTASLSEAEREIEIVLDHVRMAGVLEGIMPQVSTEPDNGDHYGRAQTLDEWQTLGLGYEGRKLIRFEPERVMQPGGLKAFGYKVIRHDEQGPKDGWPADNGQEITEQVIVLERRNEVTREHMWERSSSMIPDSLPDLTFADGTLVTHNRARHAMIGDYSVEVWWRGDETPGTPPREDAKITSVLGVVMPYSRTKGTVSGARALYEVDRDVPEGRDPEDVIDEVFNACREYARAQPHITSTISSSH